MPDSVRLDVWLDVACLFKTRSEAQRACKVGRVTVNGVVAKPHRDVRAGDDIVLNRPGGRRQILKVLGVADSFPEQEVTLGEPGGRLAVVGWGSTFGPIHQAVRRARRGGLDVSHIHVRHIWPLPKNLGELLRTYDRIIVPEMNNGQFKTLLRDQYLVDARPLNKISGHPFKIVEIEAAIEDALR